MDGGLTTEREPTVVRELKLLSNRISNLATNLGTLRERLKPILTPAPLSPTSNTEDEAMCPLAAEIQNQRDNVGVLISEIGSIISALEI